MTESKYIKIFMDEEEEEEEEKEKKLTLVARKPCFGLPTSCPACLPVYIYLTFARISFHLDYSLIYPDSDQIPYVDRGTYVAYNNEKGGVIRSLKEDGIVVDLDSDTSGIPEWVSAEAMIDSWLSDALMYELWLGTNGDSAYKIYYSDLPWPIGKVLSLKQVYTVKRLLGITKENADRREHEIYSQAKMAYGSLSTRLAEQSFLFKDRPTSLDASFLSHLLVTLYALPETSVLRSKLLERSNLVRYAENFKMEYIDLSPSSIPQSQLNCSSSSAKRGPSIWNSKAKPKPRRENTKEEKKFQRRAKYFCATQVVVTFVFLSLLGRSNDVEMEHD